jgi:formiminotetrahydrofolate cyclodeaminase
LARQENSTATHRITETNSNISSDNGKNSPEVNRENPKNVANVAVNLNHIEEKNTVPHLPQIQVSLPEVPENLAHLRIRFTNSLSVS